MELLRDYGGEPADYIAAKYLVAWQFLGMPRVNTGMARAVVAALHHELLEDFTYSPVGRTGVIDEPPDAGPSIATAITTTGSTHDLRQIAGRETAATS